MRARLLGEGEGRSSRSYECLELKMAGKSVSWLSEMVSCCGSKTSDCFTGRLNSKDRGFVDTKAGWLLCLNIFGMFTPKTWGRWFPFWRAYFSDGLVQPPTSCCGSNTANLGSKTQGLSNVHTGDDTTQVCKDPGMNSLYLVQWNVTRVLNTVYVIPKRVTRGLASYALTC